LPLIVILTALVNFAVAFGIYLAFLVVTGHFPGWVVAAAIPVVALLVAFAAGLAILFGTLNVFFRDIGQAVTVLLQFWFWLTPIVYPVTALPEFVRRWLALNPVAPLVGALQRIFSEGRMPEWGSLASPLVVTAVALLLAAVTFRANAGDIVDEL
jgi:lipopolysaccharide transport system permease protein